MPAARGVKRAASKSSAATASTGPKNKKKRGAIQLEVPSAPKKRGRVLACGQGDVGQLGLGEDVMETSKFLHVVALGDKIVDVCAGGMHTIALDSDGKVWTYGCNDEGALGRATANEKEEGTPKTVPLPQSAVAITAGDSHSAALLANGDVYAWGAFRDSHGSMGLVVRGREGKACREPVKLEIGEQAVAIASGGDHLVVLSTSGSVYTMGCGEQGQLGRLSQRSASRDARQGFSALLVPAKVTLKGGAGAVWAGYHATFALDTQAGKLFAWGLNNYGQLGITGEKRKTALFSPTECDAFSGGGSWTRVAAGQHHSLALDSAGQVYAIGRCEYGRLGLGDRVGDAEVLEPIPALQNKRCVSIAAGTSNSFAVTDSGEVLSWGMGSEGQLGTASSCDAPAPTPAALSAAADRTPVHVSAGGQHTVLLLEDPSAAKEPSPAPAKETAEEKTEESQETEPAPAPERERERERERQRKRARKHEQDEEISSTSSQPAAASEDKPQKLNGKDKVETPMDVDDTDKPQDKDDEDTKMDDLSNKDTEMEHTESDKDSADADTADTDADTKRDIADTADIADTSSQDTTESDAKRDSDGKDDDVDMDKLNGTGNRTRDPAPVETIPADTALTSSA